ncbi:unnamed protein product [Rhizoctonia solani]|uniref:DUF7918 domain-containing protein n=1 Tax=Rhizoctonia solani TaxID=456999 RepID=A0A8H2XBU4_9AGAM|nr:unnamed protein product [Rhizoctonia solani]
MPLNLLGISVWIADSEGNELPEYDVKLVKDDEIECWIPSTEGSNFKLMWRFLNPMSNLDLSIRPSLDGIELTGIIWTMGGIAPGRIYEKDSQQTGLSTARLYTFGKRIITDREDATKPSRMQLQYLNTIAAQFTWGSVSAIRPHSDYSVPPDAVPLNEKSIKKGHSGSAELGKTVTRAKLPTRGCIFHANPDVKPAKFVFRYASRDWLKARDIIPPSPQTSPSRVKPKRKRSFGSDVIDIDDLSTDDEKPMLPAPAPKKKQRAVEQKGIRVKAEA